MLTRSTTFAANAATAGEQRDAILKITISATSYLFAMRPFPRGLGGDPIYPLLMDCGVLSESIDIYSKQSQVSDVTFVLSDQPLFPVNGGNPMRASELLAGVTGATCQLYYWVDGVTTLTDCLLVFDGSILQCLTANKETLQITAMDKSKMWDVPLPPRYVVEEYPSAPASTRGVPIPLVYGDFSTVDPYDTDESATGLCRAVAYDSNGVTGFAIADQIIMAINMGFRDAGGPSVLPSAYFFASKGSATVPAYMALAQACYLDFMPSSSSLPSDFSLISQYVEDATNRGNLGDNIYSTTKCNFRDRYSDDGSTAYGLSLFRLQNIALLQGHMANGGGVTFYYRYLNADGDYSEAGIDFMKAWLYYERIGATYGRRQIGYAATVAEEANADRLRYQIVGWDYISNYPYSLKTTLDDLKTDYPTSEWVLGIEFKTTEASVADASPASQIIASMRTASVRYGIATPWQQFAWAACQGKAYTTTLAGGTRASGYVVGDLIEDPAFIIEDLYRTYGGLVDADIDVDSFDNAANPSIKARINIYERVQLSTIVRQLSEQSTVIVHASAAGKVRCIALHGAPSADIKATIPRARLLGDNLEMSKTANLVNTLNVHSRYRPEYGHYDDFDIYTDATSITAVGERSADFQWPNISHGSAANVANHLVNSTNGVWSKEHIVVRFATPAMAYSHLQIGDWIKLNADVDLLKEPFGGTWADHALLITGISKHTDYTSFEAMALTSPAIDDAPSPPPPSPSPEPSPSPDPSPLPGKYVTNAYYANFSPLTSNGSFTEKPAMIDGDLTTFIGTTTGAMALNDHYLLEFGEAVTLAEIDYLVFDITENLNGVSMAGNWRLISSDSLSGPWTQRDSYNANSGLVTYPDYQIKVYVGPNAYTTAHKFWQLAVGTTVQDVATNLIKPHVTEMSASGLADPAQAMMYKYNTGDATGPVALTVFAELSDLDYATEFGSDYGEIVVGDEFGVRLPFAGSLSNYKTFKLFLDRDRDSALIQGAVQLYYSHDNNNWIAYGPLCTYNNGGMVAVSTVYETYPQIWVHCTPSVQFGYVKPTARYWKCVVVDQMKDVSGELGVTELQVTTTEDDIVEP